MLRMNIQLIKSRSNWEQEALHLLYTCQRLRAISKPFSKLADGAQVKPTELGDCLNALWGEMAKTGRNIMQFTRYIEQDDAPHNPLVIGDQREQWKICLAQNQELLERYERIELLLKHFIQIQKDAQRYADKLSHL